MKTIKKIGIAIIMIVVGAAYAYGTWSRPIYNTDIGSLSYEKTDFLTTGSVMEQTFICGNSGFSGFTIKMLKQDGQEIGNYKWTVEDLNTGKVVGKGTISEADTETRLFESSNPQKQGMVNVELPKQKDSKGKEYKLTLKAEEMKDTESVAVYITEKNSTKSELIVNDNAMTDKASIVKVNYKRFNVETFIVFLGIVIYLWAFIKFMYKLFR